MHGDWRLTARAVMTQVCSYDCRHTLATVCRKARHTEIDSLDLWVYEEEPAALVRHMLLMHVLLDSRLTVQERVETLLELHGNALLRDKTAAYLGEHGAQCGQDVEQPAAGCWADDN